MPIGACRRRNLCPDHWRQWFVCRAVWLQHLIAANRKFCFQLQARWTARAWLAANLRTYGYDMVWYDMIWYGMVWYDLIWYDGMWCDMIWYDLIWWPPLMENIQFHLFWFGGFWLGFCTTNFHHHYHGMNAFTGHWHWYFFRTSGLIANFVIIRWLSNWYSCCGVVTDCDPIIMISDQ